jgi:hypothetical protein
MVVPAQTLAPAAGEGRENENDGAVPSVDVSHVAPNSPEACYYNCWARSVKMRQGYYMGIVPPPAVCLYVGEYIYGLIRMDRTTSLPVCRFLGA